MKGLWVLALPLLVVLLTTAGSASAGAQSFRLLPGNRYRVTAVFASQVPLDMAAFKTGLEASGDMRLISVSGNQLVYEVTPVRETNLASTLQLGPIMIKFKRVERIA